MAWFFRTHLKNTINKADDLDEAYGKLREEFQRINTLSQEGGSRDAA